MIIKNDIKPPMAKNSKWPWKQMNVGDYVEFIDRKAFIKARNNATLLKRRKGLDFIAKWENNLGRIWRVE